MAYGTLKVDTIVYTSNGVDTTTTISGLANGTFANITSSGTISGTTITGDTGQFTTITAVTGIFTATLSGATVTGVAAQFTNVTGGTAGFTTITGQTVTGTTGQFGTITGNTAGFTTVTGTTVTGIAGQFGTITGNTAGFTTVTGTTVTGTAGQFGTITGNTAGFTTVTGTTITGTNFGVGSGITFPDATVQTTAAVTIANAATTTGIQTFTAAQRGAVVVVPYATGISLNLSSGNNFQITLTGNTTLQNPTNIVSGQAGVITIIQGTASNTMAFSTGWQYPGGSGSTPTITATSGAVDLLVYYTKDTSSVSYRLVQDVKA